MDSRQGVILEHMGLGGRLQLLTIQTRMLWNVTDRLRLGQIL